MRPITIVDRGRGPELAGTRITVFDVIPYLRAGRSPTWIAALLRLSTPEVEALVRYIEEHRDEVMTENQKIEERIARGNPPEVEARLLGSRARLLALRDELRRKTQRGETNGTGDPGGR
jgi:uncharacterized protein (DUF433 family)